MAAAPGPLLTYLRLFRLPNVFTAFSDVAMGYFFVHQTLGNWPSLLLLAAASGMLYTAGMVLNDLYDVERDRRERPQRPLPSGAIGITTARRLGYGLLLGGWALCWLTGLVYLEPLNRWAAGCVGTALALSVVGYDAILKKTWAGPAAMGACRFFNVLLGMSLMPSSRDPEWLWGWGPHHLIVAAGIGVYIVGVTWFARTEAQRSNRLQLALALATLISGLVCLAGLNLVAPPYFRLRFSLLQWPLVLAVLMAPVLRRAGAAIADPRPAPVQQTIKHAILSLIVLDAAVALQVSVTPWGYVYALGVVALLIPTLVLGKWVYST